MDKEILQASPEQYAEAVRQMLPHRTQDELNAENHLALEKKMISLDQFQAAARVLAKEILKR